MGMQRLGDLEISQDLVFERRSWRVQRIGWVFFSLILVAALLGVFGGAGPFERATAGDGSAFRTEYSRFARHNDPTTMLFRLQPGAAAGDQARIWVDSQYLEAVQIERVEPQPDRVEVSMDRHTYIFSLAEAGEGGAFLFHILPQEEGQHAVRVGLDGGAEYRFNQFIYP